MKEISKRNKRQSQVFLISIVSLLLLSCECTWASHFAYTSIYILFAKPSHSIYSAHNILHIHCINYILGKEKLKHCTDYRTVSKGPGVLSRQVHETLTY